MEGGLELGEGEDGEVGCGERTWNLLGEDEREDLVSFCFKGVDILNLFESLWNTLNHFPWRNSRERKSGKELFSPLINSISKSKLLNKACHLAKICFETKFLTSFSKTLFAALQSILSKNFLQTKSSSNFVIHNTIDKSSFLIVE